MQHQVCTVHVLRNTEVLRERYQLACDADGLITAIVVTTEEKVEAPTGTNNACERAIGR